MKTNNRYTLNYLINEIQGWSEERGLPTGSRDKQLIKIHEETGELDKAHLRNDLEELTDAIGDIFVTLIIYCQQTGLDFESCVKGAYDEIKGRKGKLVNGTFIKEGDLK